MFLKLKQIIKVLACLISAAAFTMNFSSCKVVSEIIDIQKIEAIAEKKNASVGEEVFIEVSIFPAGSFENIAAKINNTEMINYAKVQETDQEGIYCVTSTRAGTVRVRFENKNNTAVRKIVSINFFEAEKSKKITYMNGSDTLADIPDADGILNYNEIKQAPAIQGKIFVGWYTDSALTNEVQYPFELTLEKTILYAKYNDISEPVVYEIIFDENYTGGEKSKQSVESGNEVNIPTPVRNGYIFAGWFTDENCSDGNNINTPYIATSNKTFYAKWTEEQNEIKVTGITLQQKSLSMEDNDPSVKLNYSIEPENATNKSVKWTSSNESVATVVNGTVTPVAEGNATISVTTVDGNKTASCSIEVKAHQIIPSPAPDPSSFIFCHNPSWSKANIYAWNEGAGENAAWPGQSMTAIDDGYFYFDTSVWDSTYQKVIFNNGSDQTTNLSYPADLSVTNCYDVQTGEWVKYEPSFVVKPTITASTASGKFKGTSIDVTFTVKDAASATYSIDGASPVKFNNSVALTLGNGIEEGESTTVTITAVYTDNSKSITQDFTYTRKRTIIITGDYLLQADSAKAQQYNLAQNIKDGEILQCFCWSMDEISEYMPEIAAAGFSAIQTSVIQVCKEQTLDDGEGNGRIAKNVWWAYYQPAAFTIDDTGDNAIVDVESFRNMVSTAHKYGVKVIVDVVANHLGNQWVADCLCERAYYYEWEIAGMDKSYEDGGYIPYGKDNEGNQMYWVFGSNAPASSGANLSTVKYVDTYYYKDTLKFHKYMVQNGDDAGNVTRGNIGMMDLATEDPVVQRRVGDYLCELVSYGVDGFRFDAAKHIETPWDDASLRSDFWKVVMTRAQSKADELFGGDKKLYAYGEILNRTGNGRKLQWYIDCGVNVTDNHMGERGSAGSSFNVEYNFCEESWSAYYGNLVSWAESHDSYMGSDGNTSSWPREKINLHYTSIAGNKGVVPLYCARFKDFESSVLGEVACKDEKGWASNVIAGINKFRNIYNNMDAPENNTGSTVERGTGQSNQNGVCAMGFSGSITVGNLADGQYTDLVSGNTFTVSGGTLTGNADPSGVIAVTALAN